MTTQRVHVKIGDLQVLVAEGTLFSIGLGSCVAVALYDADNRIGGLAHIMLPDAASATGRPGRYAPTAVPQLLEMMLQAGARADAIFARIAGGSAMFAELLPPANAQLGERNVIAVRQALNRANIPLHAEHIGGTAGRSVFFDAQDGSLVVRIVQREDVLL